MKGVALFLAIIILTSCKQSSQYFSPPVFLGIHHIDADSITLDFDQEVTLTNITLDPRLKLTSTKHYTIFVENMQPAEHYWVQAHARVGNRISEFILNFWGVPSETPPKLLINELSIIHNKNYSDAIELVALEVGDIAGTTVYLGSPLHYSHRYIFPSYTVKAGEILILHAQKEAQFSFPQAPGLGNTREVISIAHSPYDIPYHGVAYEKASTEQTLSSQKRRFDANLAYLQEHNLWQGPPLDSMHSSATRTLNRRAKAYAQPEDATFWYITTNRGTSIGKANTPDEHQPKT